MRQIVKYTLVVLGTISAVFLIYQFRAVILLLVISLALTATNRPLLSYLGFYRIPGFLAQLLILIIIFTAVIGFVFLIGPELTAEIQLLTNDLLVEYGSIYSDWGTGSAWQQMIGGRLPEPGSLVDLFLGTSGELLLLTAVNLTQNLGSFFSNLFIVLIFSLLWDPPMNFAFLNSELPPVLEVPFISSILLIQGRPWREQSLQSMGPW